MFVGALRAVARRGRFSTALDTHRATGQNPAALDTPTNAAPVTIKFHHMNAWLGLALLASSVAGCAAWHVPRLDLNRYRDPRAVDIDDRMSSVPPAKTTRDEPSR